MVRGLGIEAWIENPWQAMTKGEVLRWFRDNSGASDEVQTVALSATHSCARSGSNYEGFPPLAHCGVCFACVVRRAAFVSAGIRDDTEYIEVQLRADPNRRSTWLSSTRRRDYAAIRAAVTRGGFTLEDVLSINLPLRYSPQEALGLANRGLNELDRILIP
jgi:hypothetical protein